MRQCHSTRGCSSFFCVTAVRHTPRRKHRHRNFCTIDRWEHAWICCARARERLSSRGNWTKRVGIHCNRLAHYRSALLSWCEIIVQAIPAGSPPALRINKVSIIRSKPIRVCVGGGTSIRFDLRRRHCRSLHSLLIGLIVRKHPRRLKHLKLGEERKLPQSPNTKSCRQWQHRREWRSQTWSSRHAAIRCGLGRLRNGWTCELEVLNILLWGLLTLCYFSGNFKFKGEDCSVSTSSSVCTIAPLGTLSSHRTFSLYVHSPANISRCLSLFSSFLFWSSQSTFQEARLRDPKQYSACTSWISRL